MADDKLIAVQTLDALRDDFQDAASKNDFGAANAAHNELVYKTVELGTSVPDEFVRDALKELQDNKDCFGHYGPYDDLMNACEGNELAAAIECRNAGFMRARRGETLSMKHVMSDLNMLAMKTTRRKGKRSIVR